MNRISVPRLSRLTPIDLASVVVAFTPLYSLFSYGVVFAAALVLAMFQGVRIVLTRARVDIRWDCLPYVALMAWVFASTTWAYDRTHSLTSTLVLFGFFTIFLTFAGRRPHDVTTRHGLYSTGGMILVLACCVGTIIYFYGTMRPEGKREHMIGSYDTRVSSYVTTIMPLLVCGVFYGKRRLFWVVIVFAAVLIGVATGARAGLVGPAVGLVLGVILISFLTFRHLHKRVLWGVPIAIFVTIAIGFAVIRSGIAEESLNRIADMNLQDTFQIGNTTVAHRSQEEDFGRKAMYATGWNIVQEYDLYGIGFGSLGFYVDDAYGRYVMSHNIIITAFGELGLIGGALFVFCVLTLCSRWVTAYRNAYTDLDRAFLRACAGCLMLVFVVAMIRPQQDNPLLPMCVGAIHSIAWSRSESEYDYDEYELE